MAGLDPEKPCRCQEPTEAAIAEAPVRKVELPDGMIDGTFTLSANTGEELGRQVDTFLRSIDYDRFEASSGYSVHVDARHIRSMQSGTVMSTFGPFWTEIQVSRL
jgi:hypothetical protein